MTTGNTADAVIVGGGLHGLSAALHLARAGWQPVVLEKDRYCGRHASGVNAGGVRRLGRHYAEVPLSVEALKVWHNIAELVDDDCGFNACGQIKIAETEAELDGLRARAVELRRLGFEHERLITADRLRDIVPALQSGLGALWCPEDGAADPFRTTQAFRRKATALGVRIEYDAAVSGLQRRAGTWRVDSAGGRFEAPLLVNAAGAWGGELCRLIGEPPPPLQPQALMLMVSERVAPFLTPVLGAAGRTLSFKQFANGTVLIGGGYRGRAEPQHNRSWTDPVGLAASARTVTALFPQLAGVRLNRFLGRDRRFFARTASR